MTIQQLRYAIEIDKTGSINKAALSMFASQPTISIAITQLEKEIGYKIFLRTNKGISLTSRGVEFIYFAKKVIDEYENLNNICLDKPSRHQIKLRISSQHYAFLSDAFVEFISDKKYDNYHFVIKETRSLEAIEDVYQKKSDIAFILINEANEKILKEIFQKKEITFNSLTCPTAHVFINKSHPLAMQKMIKYEQLEKYPVVIFEQDGNGLLSEEFVVSKKLDKVIYVNDRATLISIIANTNVYNIGTGYLSKEMKNAGMVAIPLVDTTIQEIGWIHLNSYTPTRDIIEFIEVTKELLKNKIKV